MTLTFPTSAEDCVQAAILGRLVEDLLRAGFAIDVNDNNGDRETHLARSTDRAAILASIFNPEIDASDYCLDCFKDGKADAHGHSFGMVRLIDGNGSSVINDYSVALESEVAGANTLANRIDEGYSNEGWVVARLRALEKAARDVMVWDDPLHPDHDAMVEAYADDAAANERNITGAEIKGQLRAALVKALDVEA